MVCIDWRPGTQIDGPVYVDANVLVGAIIRNHRLYASCASVIGQLLVTQCCVQVSAVAVEECLWAIAGHCYREMYHHKPTVKFTKATYSKWRDQIFAKYSARMTAIGSMLRDWARAGVPIDVIPTMGPEWDRTLELLPLYMRQCRLTPADACHLALAENYARTFITADADFRTAANVLSAPSLTILHIT